MGGKSRNGKGQFTPRKKGGKGSGGKTLRK